MQPNRFVLLAGAVILSAGIIRAAQTGKPVSRTVEGGIIFIVLLSLLDALGPGPSKLASAFAVLGMVVVLVNDVPDILGSSGVIVKATGGMKS